MEETLVNQDILDQICEKTIIHINDNEANKVQAENNSDLIDDIDRCAILGDN